MNLRQWLSHIPYESSSLKFDWDSDDSGCSSTTAPPKKKIHVAAKSRLSINPVLPLLAGPVASKQQRPHNGTPLSQLSHCNNIFSSPIQFDLCNDDDSDSDVPIVLKKAANKLLPPKIHNRRFNLCNDEDSDSDVPIVLNFHRKRTANKVSRKTPNSSCNSMCPSRRILSSNPPSECVGTSDNFSGSRRAATNSHTPQVQQLFSSSMEDPTLPSIARRTTFHMAHVNRIQNIPSTRIHQSTSTPKQQPDNPSHQMLSKSSPLTLHLPPAHRPCSFPFNHGTVKMLAVAVQTENFTLRQLAELAPSQCTLRTMSKLSRTEVAQIAASFMPPKCPSPSIFG